MNLDHRIREELARQVDEIDALPDDDGGLFGMLRRVFVGGLKRWAAYAMALTLVFLVLTVWCVWQVVTLDAASDRLLWGLGALFGFHAMSMLKLWFFMEMNRNSVLREIKRVEVKLDRLAAGGVK
ncbi:MAG: DUF6768 family protein [Wenzhouxiangellaceae bacterium]|nr:DUF6768 family protein [Wenzhouxiangellaceae bacterium]